MHRLQVVLGHLAGRPESSSALQAAPCSAGFLQASASDVVVVHGRRTPIGRASRGCFKDTTPDELLSAVLTAVLQDVKLKPEQLGDISVGNVLQPGAGAIMARIAHLFQRHPRDCTFVYGQQTVFIGTAGSGQHCWWHQKWVL
ncbi:mCG21883, isoform CRA_d [Mus musculus]|nr:mCG21883, isoform CRA_d [Mus musculus]